MNSFKQKLIKFIKSEGVDLRTDTKARGNLGLFSENRIDIHKKLDDEKFIEVLLHEYAHLVHKGLEPDMARTGGSLSVLFNLEDASELEKIEEELVKVTNIVDENSLLVKFDAKKYACRIKMKAYENLIKKDYPDFLRSKPFVPFEKYIKHSDARFLLRYDKIRLVTPFLRREKVYSIDTIEKDFPDMPMSFALYIKMCSLNRKAKSIQKRKSRLKKYYERPNELFARFVQGLFLHSQQIQELAPNTYARFNSLLDEEYYGGLRKIIAFLRENSL